MTKESNLMKTSLKTLRTSLKTLRIAFFTALEARLVFRRPFFRSFFRVIKDA